ncbi:PKD-like family lipoprotein [Pedobacter metabolipauper]|nr:PKD-like family lipoprotein [Pedobacter metabolipauper]
MKLYKYTLLLLSLAGLGSCSKDLGNYEYHDINEVTITGVNKTYTLRRGFDTLRINPTILGTMDESDPSRYQFRWILRNTTGFLDTIGEERNLVYPIVLEPIPHDLYYRVTDKKTGVEWRSNSVLTISTPFSRGLLLMGEDDQGYAEAEMLSMLSDTLHLKHLLSESGLPRLREPVSFLHTGGNLDSYLKLWALTKTGSYYLDRITMKATTNNNFSKSLFMSEQIDPETLHPIAVAPQIRTAAGAISATFYRVMLTKAGDLFACFLLINGGDFYNNPINRVATAQQVRIPAAPYLLYSTGDMTTVMWYDTQNQRFLNYNGFGSATASTVLADVAGSAFPWNQAQSGRSLVYAENTRNTDGGSTNGNSFAIMKDAGNAHYVYKFYASGAAPAKRAAYTILPIATDFAKADHYAFSSNRSVIFYSVGGKLYAYDYNPGNERFYQFPEIGADEITMLKFDTQIDYLANSLYIGTYNSTTKGTLRRFTLGTNPNVVDLLPAAKSTWSGLVKIKDINWRAVN